VLAPFVDCLWLLEDAAPPVQSAPEIVLPDGRIEVVFHFGTPPARAEAGVFTRQCEALLVGQMTRHVELMTTGALGMVAARFKPFGAAHFFRAPLAELTDQVADLSAVIGRVAAQVREMIANAPSHTARLALLEGFLLARLRGAPDPTVERATDLLHRTATDGIRTGALAKQIGVSERQLERKFRERVGVSAKTLQQLSRFQRFVRLIQSTRAGSLTDAALSCGYYDQAHLIREFKRFAGRTPSAFIAESHQLSDQFTTT